MVAQVAGDRVGDGAAAVAAGNGRAFCPGGMSRRIEGYNGYT